jgi:glucose/arabinose dehydrogenase
MRKTHVFLTFIFLSVLPSFLAAQTLKDPSLKVEQLVSGLDTPTIMAFIGPKDILVLQKNDGKVRRIIAGVLQPGHVHDVAVDSASERGLLGMTVHPQFPSTPFVYLYYTQSSTGSDTAGSPTPLGNRVYRYTWNGAIFTDPTLILSLPVTPGPNHDGGIITFGPDGKLYVVIGDLNRNGKLQNFPTGPAPDDTSVILRLNPDGSVPTDNPFFSQGGNLAKYYAYGVRNSYGLAFDPVTAKLWMTENGPDTFDEINLVNPGFNSGWERIMGPNSRDPQGTGDLFVVPGSHYSDPEFSWLDTVGPTALVFLNSTVLGSQYENDLFAGDINHGTLYHFPLNAARSGFTFEATGLADLVADNATELDDTIFGTGFGGITDLKVGSDGFLYIVSISGSIYVISPIVPVDEFIVDNAPAGQSGNGRSFTGAWCASSAPNPFGLNSLFSCGSGVETYRWRPTLPASGLYDVYVRWTQHPNRSTSVPITVCHATTCTTRQFNQQQNGGRWILHDQYDFDAGTSGSVQVTDQNGQAAADAVRFVPAP